MKNKATALLKILNPALLSLIVDGGRAGHQHIGICEAGPMDRFAFTLCNALLGLDNQAAIEVCGDGFELKAMSDITVCITGGSGICLVNDEPVPMWQLVGLKVGDELRIQSDEKGYRYYIGINAKLNSEKVFGSYSTVMRERAGGVSGDGMPLIVGDELTGKHYRPRCQGRSFAQNDILNQLVKMVYQERSIGVIRGSQFEQFERPAWLRLLSNSYRIERDSNRMGIRLSGQSLDGKKSPMRSEGVTMGALQIPPNGQPIVLMADRQTLGGYPKIANVAMVDLSFLAQRQPGTSVSFNEIDVNTARNLWRLRDNLLHKLRTTI